MNKKLFILFALFSLLALAENTEKPENMNALKKAEEENEEGDDFMDTKNWKRPVYEGYPYQRAKHPFVYYEDGNRENEIFNFCGNEDGFQIEDFTEECFIAPFAMSILIPPVCFLIVFLFICYSACIFSCTRCCCGPCCFATNQCCCCGDRDRKAYKTKDWLIFMIITIVVFVCIQLPFFIIGIFGNASMTVALTDVTDSILDVYPKAKDVSNEFVTFLDSVDFTILQNISDLLHIEEGSSSDAPKDSTFKRMLFQKRENRKTADKQETDAGSDFENKLGDLKETVDSIFTWGDSIMYYVELGVDLMIIVREVVFDLILILPFIGGALMVLGGIIKIHQLAISFFPCALVFSFMSIIFVALEYPVTTLIADVCVVYYNVLEQADPAKAYEIKTLDDLTNLTSMGTGELINQVLLVLDDCEKSMIGDLKGSINSVVDNLINSFIESIELDKYMNLTNVCNVGTSDGLFYLYDGRDSSGLHYSRCKGYISGMEDYTYNTDCVYPMYSDAINSDKKGEPILKCKENENTKDPANKLEALLNVLASLKNIQLSNADVFWVNSTDFAAYTATQEQSLDLENMADKYKDLLEEYLGALGFGDLAGEGQTKRARKADLGVGKATAFCADVDGNIKSEGSYYRHTLVEGKGSNYIEGYMMTPIACSAVKYVDVQNCGSKVNSPDCPQLVRDNFAQLDDVLAAIDFIDELRNLINQARAQVDKMIDFVGCDTIGGIADGIQYSVCQEYLEAETFFVVGLVAYSIILWGMYIFGLLAVKRFNRVNYEYVDKSTRYYAEGEVEMV